MKGRAMRRVVLLLLALAAVALVPGGRSVAGQTVPPGTPSPTPTPTVVPALPAGSSLLRRMQAATERLGTRREVAHDVIVEPNGTRNVLDSTADVSYRRDRERIAYTGQGASAAPEEAILVGHLEATRMAGASWDCIDWNKKLPGSQVVTLSEDPNALPHGRITTIGAETRGGVLVWHVRVRQHESSTLDTLTITTDATLDYYIAQSDYTLREDHRVISIRDDTGTSTITGTTHYSDYGAAFHINLPRACKTFHAPLVPNLPPLFHRAVQRLQSNSVHLTVHYTLARQGKVRTTIAEAVDRLPHNAGYRMTLIRTVSGTRGAAVLREESIRLRGRVATRVEGQGWVCGLVPIASPPHGPERLPGTAEVTALGFRDNTSAWRVHAQFPNRTGHPGVVAAEDVFISAFRPQLVQTVYRRTDRSGQETLRIDYSRYGEHLSLRLPPTCRISHSS